MTTATAPVCRKPGCQSAATRICAEGHAPLEACPWFGSIVPDAIRGDTLEAHDNDAAISSADFIALPSGAALNPQALDDFLRARPTRLVAVVGDRDSGKTTLICAIYEGFLKGRFPDWLFCGSRTLVAFEERSHDSRTASGRLLPDTPHTSLAEGLHFFHLAVRRSSDKAALRIELMLSDRAGESFATVRDKPATSAQLQEVIRAERIVILLDGRRVADPESRANAMQGVRKLIRALIDGGALTAHSIVQVLLTKNDLIARADDATGLRAKITEFFDLLVRDFGPKVSRLTFLEVSARDPKGELESGIDGLLADWLATEKIQVRKTPVSGIRGSEFDRLLERSGLGYLP